LSERFADVLSVASGWQHTQTYLMKEFLGYVSYAAAEKWNELRKNIKNEQPIKK
jgi:hypothetical protein